MAMKRLHTEMEKDIKVHLNVALKCLRPQVGVVSSESELARQQDYREAQGYIKTALDDLEAIIK